MEWEDVFQSQILDRGYDYYQRGLVTNLKQTSDGVQATVKGSKAYHVTVSVQNEQVVDAECNFPYAQGGKYCKHMAAVMFASFPDDEMEQATPKSQPTGLGVVQMVLSATEQQVRDFLTETLLADGDLAAKFALRVAPKNAENDRQLYLQQISDIIESYQDYSGFIDYQSAGPFEEELSTFIRENIQAALDQQHPKLAFRLINKVATKLARVDIDDSDGEIMMLAQACRDIWQQVIDQADAALKRQAFTWFQKHSQESMGAFEEDVEDLLFKNFTAPKFLQKKLTWTAEKLDDAEKDGSEWQAEQWAMFHLKTLVKLDAADDEIEGFCRAHIRYDGVRQYYVDFSLQRERYDRAIQILVNGRKRGQIDGLNGLVQKYSRQLLTLYKRLERPEAYRQELWNFVTTYSPADLEAYQELETLYPAADWPTEREKLLAALPKHADVVQLYAEDHLDQKLLQTVLAQRGLIGVQTYEKLLKPKFSRQLLQKYVAVAQQMAEQTGDRQHYRDIVKVLNKMTTFPMGMSTADHLIQEWRVKYARRPAMLDELKRFDSA
ncbi:SWIM zinc finger family protein [Levilactobacillus fuyuanensis]|uniref:SWIM zinc finger domain-containing protein n=1 Tax=Levilactobacillus fuyuanensis TaxID=2486022 RepID=A0ABW4H6T9_9LACO|nr:hypothetical protein [Levilactobacillus fuyuanensis]